jgi:hypothetical protein
MPSIELSNMQLQPSAGPSLASSPECSRCQSPSSGRFGSRDHLDSRNTSITEVGSVWLSSQTTLTEPKADSDEAQYHVFTPGMKAFIVFNVSAVAALSGLSSNIYFPVQEDISAVGSLDRLPYHTIPLAFR